MNAAVGCPEQERWRLLLEGSLAPENHAGLLAHLEECSACQQRLRDLGSESEVWSKVRQAMAQPAPPEAMLNAALAELKRADPQATTLPPASDSLADQPPHGLPAPGDIVGPYAVREVLGQGGMGIVYRADDRALRRSVALKLLAPYLASSPAARARFEREARAAAAVRHEHVVAVHAVAEHQGMPYLVMEHVAGRSLQDRLDREGALPAEEVLLLGAQLARALEAAHERGVIHRDLKPANVLLEPGRTFTRLTDFGLARVADDVALTQSGLIAGTPQYMAPEQAQGLPTDARADLFSLGSVLYALATGRVPFEGETTVAVLYNVCHVTPPPIEKARPDLPRGLGSVILKLHARRPEDRFQSAREVAELLEGLLAHLRHPDRVPAPRVPAPPGGPGEWRSQTTLWGLPLYHVAFGPDPATGRRRVARGIIAVGDVAVGVVAVGGVAVGGIALGGGAVGLVALGGLAMGGLALGGLAVGLVAAGGLAVGWYALGGGALGLHAIDGRGGTPEAYQAFRRLWPF